MKINIAPEGGRIELRGSLVEGADLDGLIVALRGRDRAIIDLAGIDRINSAGVRVWFDFVQKIPESADVSLARCPVGFVRQLNILPGFSGRARIASYYVPYICLRCNAAREELVDAGAELPDARSLGPCPRCGHQYEPDYLVDEYLSFLARTR